MGESYQTDAVRSAGRSHSASSDLFLLIQRKSIVGSKKKTNIRKEKENLASYISIALHGCSACEKPAYTAKLTCVGVVRITGTHVHTCQHLGLRVWEVFQTDCRCLTKRCREICEVSELFLTVLKNTCEVILVTPHCVDWISSSTEVSLFLFQGCTL